MKMRFIWDYQGYNGGFFDRGPNWFQFTFPPSHRRRRCSLIFWRPTPGHQ